MAEEGNSRRRLIMMLTIILAGSAVTFMDLSPVAIILIAAVIGLVMLFALNMISFDEVKEIISGLKARLNKPVNLKKTKNPKKPEKEKIKKEEKDKAKTEDTKKDDSQDSSSKKSFLSGIFGFLSNRKAADSKTKKIDELLDKTLNEEKGPAAETGAGESEFSDFDSFDLGLEEEDVSQVSGDAMMGAFEEEISDSTIADILAKEGIELELDDEEFPTAPSNEEEKEGAEISEKGLGDINELDGDISGLDFDGEDFGDLEEIDLDELETGDDIDIGEEDSIDDMEIGSAEEEPAEPEITPPEEEDILSAPPKEWTQTKGISESVDNLYDNPMSLSLGEDTDDDDLFAMLKSDTKKVVSVQETSLVRDLKDTNISSEELVGDLEDILEQFGIEKEQVKEKNEISDEGDIND
ncbi:MAG: hypothetical protein JXQ82_00300 [Methanomicrobiaceae archaeon]|nr:hypothetical protein [Methanomicrobiaceae archaeon]